MPGGLTALLALPGNLSLMTYIITECSSSVSCDKAQVSSFGLVYLDCNHSVL